VVCNGVRLMFLLAQVALAPMTLAGQFVVANDELEVATPARLIVAPDGRVTHRTALRVQALTRVRQSGDTLVYSSATRSLTVRRHIAPSALLIDEPMAPVTIGPVTFEGINPGRDASLFDAGTSVFFQAYSGSQYAAEQFDAPRQLTFVGNTIASYASTVPSVNPFQPDTDGDSVPDQIDNCLLMANGPFDGATAGPSQNDTDADGFGNRCDADLNDDCVVNFQDLGALRLSFFAQGLRDEDFNGDGVVNAIDLGILRAAFFMPPGPSALSTCQ